MHRQPTSCFPSVKEKDDDLLCQVGASVKLIRNDLMIVGLQTVSTYHVSFSSRWSEHLSVIIGRKFLAILP